MKENELKKIEAAIIGLQSIIDDNDGDKTAEHNSNGRLSNAYDTFYSGKISHLTLGTVRHEMDHIRYLTCSAFRVKKLSNLDEQGLEDADDFATELIESYFTLIDKYKEKAMNYRKRLVESWGE